MKNSLLLILGCSFVAVACSDVHNQSDPKFSVAISMALPRGHEEILRQATEDANLELTKEGFGKTFFPIDAFWAPGVNSKNPLVRGNYLTDSPFDRKSFELDIAKLYGSQAKTFSEWHADTTSFFPHFLRNKIDNKWDSAQKACQTSVNIITQNTLHAAMEWDQNHNLALNYLGTVTHTLQDSFARDHVKRAALSGSAARQLLDLCTYDEKISGVCYHAAPPFNNDYVFTENPTNAEEARERLTPEAQTAAEATTRYLVVVAKAFKKYRTNHANTLSTTATKGITAELKQFYVSPDAKGSGYLDCSLLAK